MPYLCFQPRATSVALSLRFYLESPSCTNDFVATCFAVFDFLLFRGFTPARSPFLFPVDRKVMPLYWCNIPLSLLLHFIPLSLSLLCPPIWAVLHHLYMYMVAFLALRILYVIALVCFVFVPCSPPESLPGKDVLCRLLPRPLPSVCFLFFSFLFRPCSPPICFGETSSIL